MTTATKNSWALWQAPVVPATWEAEARESLQPKSLLACEPGSGAGPWVAVAVAFTLGLWLLNGMACRATLKQPMEFEAALLSPSSPKRRRCAPLPGPTPSLRPPDAEPPPPPLQTQTPQPTLQQPAPPGSKRRLPTPGQIFQNIKQEYSRYQRWRHLEVVLNQSEVCASESQPHSSALTAPSSPGSSWIKKDQPTFTLRQVGIICEGLLKDYEDKIREEYKQVLNTKLAEQYESFVKFTHDQIMQRYGTGPTSYVS
ncbi:akirin-1-like [Nycticebus coucang]|uniref:akirin-1-like n=1 Tax=Nycticebus coucang TaxID=9470 RepID=UPI00234CC96E|nr:akirin-1-like [Nycticebus coucang]